MHPNNAFRGVEGSDPLDEIAAITFARIFAVTPEGPRVAHAPVLRTGPDRLRFHLANYNALARVIDGATALIVAEGPNGYLSANWYADVRGAVPTWNYVAVEAEGTVAALDRAALIDLLDGLSATLEPRVGEDWTRAKMEAPRFEAMLNAITAFEMTVTATRTTYKLSQNKSAAEAERLIAAMAAQGDAATAEAMRKARG
ncbi:MAG: FMN-binding negative transcriptional regulator [Sphingomonas sp.]|nr:FMN-binding negative transcriptional regulator [Sphingomonas sp.]